MSSSEASNLSETENNCVVCFKNVDIFSVGICDHPVCFECSTRMRVLCNQLECPICRQEMPKVVFTKEIEPFSVLKPKVERLNLQDRKYGLYFASPANQRRYYRLLEHECIICKRNGYNGPFRTFQQLKDHMRRNHELFYCDLCVANLKIFTFERSFYTRTELATHRRKGDPDNTSHRGHPLCEFCETRFMDNDELFRHLRRDHLFCHFCDLDGKHQYYNSYGELRRHYLEEHYLCEEGDCKYERFTSVFRTDIDLKAHYAAVHGRNLSKAANRQARTLEVEFTLAPRARPDMSGRGGRHYGNRHMDRQSEEDVAVGYDLEPGGPGGGPDNDRLFNNPLAAENFPSLSGDTSSLGPRTTVSNLTITSKLNPLSEENFPSLSGGNAAPPRSSAVTITTSKFNPRNTNDFPSLGGSGAVRQPAVTITRTVRGQQGLQRNSANFPTLRETSTAPSATGTVRVSSATPGGVRVSSASSTSGSVRLSVNNIQDQPLSMKSSNVSIHVNHKPNGAITTRISQTSNGPTVSVRPKSEAFPALSSSEPIPQAQWVPQKAKKQEPKPSKVAPAPMLPPSSLSDFPTLSKGKNETKGRKSSSVTVPVSNTWVNLNSFNSDAKSNNNSSSGLNDLKQKQEKIKDNKGVKTSNKVTAKSSKTIELASTETKTNDTKNYQVWENKTGDGSENKNKNKKKKGKSSTNTMDELSNNFSRMGSSSDEATLNKNEKNSSSEVVDHPKLNQIPNGITKKRSELNIGALEVSEQTEENPSGLNKPPPGFSLKPPPGFNNFILPNNTSNDLTFTSSSGQSYSIIPSPQFYPPPNFKSRNQFLIEKFKAVLQGSDAIQQFKVYSDMFRVGEIAPEKYYEHCRHFMAGEFGTIFPELLVLLPNVERQQELYKVHQSSGGTKGLEMCATCKQIVLTSDLRNHLSNHVLDNHFPVLSQAPDNNNVWNKK